VKKSEILQAIEQNILSPDPGKIRQAVAQLKKSEASPEEALKALTRGMEQARLRFQEKQSPLPDLLISLDAFRDGLRKIQPFLQGKKGSAGLPAIVIGVVEGDVHDMGKNIIAGILEVSGYPVKDLGKDVRPDDFLDAVREEKAGILALSSMMSTPLDNMREVILWARKLNPEIRILVGGAALDETLAGRLGADGYAENAGLVTGEVARLLGVKQPAGSVVDTLKAVPVPAAALPLPRR